MASALPGLAVTRRAACTRVTRTVMTPRMRTGRMTGMQTAWPMSVQMRKVQVQTAHQKGQ
jgi:hypothetical protein